MPEHIEVGGDLDSVKLVEISSADLKKVGNLLIHFSADQLGGVGYFPFDQTHGAETAVKEFAANNNGFAAVHYAIIDDDKVVGIRTTHPLTQIDDNTSKIVTDCIIGQPFQRKRYSTRSHIALQVGVEKNDVFRWPIHSTILSNNTPSLISIIDAGAIPTEILHDPQADFVAKHTGIKQILFVSTNETLDEIMSDIIACGGVMELIGRNQKRVKRLRRHRAEQAIADLGVVLDREAKRAL